MFLVTCVIDCRVRSQSVCHRDFATRNLLVRGPDSIDPSAKQDTVLQELTACPTGGREVARVRG